MEKAWVVHGVDQAWGPDNRFGRIGRQREISASSGQGFGPAVETLEGQWHGTQTVLLEFESVEAAKQWYHSDEYQAAAKLRQAAADCNGVIISGF